MGDEGAGAPVELVGAAVAVAGAVAPRVVGDPRDLAAGMTRQIQRGGI